MRRRQHNATSIMYCMRLYVIIIMFSIIYTSEVCIFPRIIGLVTDNTYGCSYPTAARIFRKTTRTAENIMSVKLYKSSFKTQI